MKRLRSLLRNVWLKRVVVVAILLSTIGFFVSYLVQNPDVLTTITSIHPAALTLMALAYTGTIIANAIVLSASLRLIGKHVSFTENISLTGYSSIVNFFGPLQSGPGFRAAYLKTRHGVALRKFLYTTLIFYGFFALINGIVIIMAFLLTSAGQQRLVFSLVGLAIVLIGSIAASRFVPRVREAAKSLRLSSPWFWLIGAGALLLSACTTAAYYIELLYVDVSITIAQTIVYAAAANLALFVSLTPGAIGFRESFLLLSERLHQIPADTVIAASIIDRAFYVLFLLGMFAMLIAIGARARLVRPKQR